MFDLKEATNKEGNLAETIPKGPILKSYLRNTNLKEANLKGVYLELSIYKKLT
jgi:uncharacterized protein YjbI with pentapeptide repeats